MQVLVRDNKVDQALRAMKETWQRGGVFREMDLQVRDEKPSVRQPMERGGLLPSNAKAPPRIGGPDPGLRLDLPLAATVAEPALRT